MCVCVCVRERETYHGVSNNSAQGFTRATGDNETDSVIRYKTTDWYRIAKVKNRSN